MDNLYEHIDQLITKYIDRTISDNEQKELLLWVEHNADHRLYFKEQLAIIRNLKEQTHEFNGEKSLSKLFNESTSERKIFSIFKILPFAASIIILLAVGAYFYQNHKTNHMPMIEVVAENNIITRFLPDHTEVIVAQNSSLNYPQKFDVKERVVVLKGKAYFKVAKNTEKPFSVINGNIVIKVLGTRFEVDENSIANLITVTVSEGSVSVSNLLNGESKVLTANQQLVCSQQGEIVIFKELNNENHLAWNSGILEFENAPMFEVAKELEKLFKKPILFKQEEIKQLQITTKINNQTISEINTILEITLNVTMIDKGENIILRYQ